MAISYDTTTIQTIALVEKLTHAHVKDCVIEPKKALFFVNEDQVGKAIGKGGSNIKLLERKLNRTVKLVGFSTDLEQFVKNLVAPLKVKEVKHEDGVVTITPKDSRSRSLLIGRQAQHLRKTESLVKRHFPIKEIKVVSLAAEKAFSRW